ncbi:MAG: DUF3426 domain-containing protein [Burkholderiaceae bacterium]|nr:DUF3426 domain-containing protein [Burkholderiaceae bacterium]
MALATQCPHCYTSFRVVNDQLKLHAGLVRCGACHQTFNGIEYLIAPGGKPKVNPHTVPAADSNKVSNSPAAPDHAAHVNEDFNKTASGQSTEQATETAAATSPVDHAPENLTADYADDIVATIVPTMNDDEAIADHDISADPVQPAPIANTELPPAASHEPASQTSANLDFDLGVDERFSHIIDPESQAQAVSQIELETRVAVMDEDSTAWSNTESKFGQQLEQLDTAVESKTLANEQVQVLDHLTAPKTEQALNEPLESHSEALEEAPDQAQEDLPKRPWNAVLLDDTAYDNLETATSDSEKPEFVLKAEKQKKYGKWLRAGRLVATLLLALSLAGQASYLWRNQLAAWLPQTKPWLIEACQQLHCRVELPAQIETLSIESHELQSLPALPNVYSLTLQLQNRANLVQAWPRLELVLKDKKNQTQLRRVFAPIDYLPMKADPTVVATGFVGNSERTLKIYFELSETVAASYDVGLFYP